MTSAAPVAVRCDALTMSYDGSRGIVDIDLMVPAGEVFGFLRRRRGSRALSSISRCSRA